MNKLKQTYIADTYFVSTCLIKNHDGDYYETAIFNINKDGDVDYSSDIHRKRHFPLVRDNTIDLDLIISCFNYHKDIVGTYTHKVTDDLIKRHSR